MSIALHATPLESTSLLEIDYRSALEAAVVDRLQWFSTANGGYAEVVGVFEQEMGGNYDDAFDRMLGRAPAMLVQAGSVRFEAKTAVTAEATVELLVWFFNNHEGSHEARAHGDDASLVDPTNDPGINRMLVDGRRALSLQEVADFATRLLPVNETPFARGEEDGLIFVQRYSTRVVEERAVWPPESSAAPAEDMKARNRNPEAELPSDTTVTTITDPLE